jgi:polyhydroxybutyrate depolymerase
MLPFPNGSSSVDDVGFTRQMVKMVSSVFTVDPQRIYSMGWSNGGYMSERLGCEAADILAGVAADASAVIIGDTNITGLALCDRLFGNHSLNYIHYTGLIDSTVAWTGGGSNHELLPSALLNFARWTRRGGCGAELEQTLNEIQTPDNLQSTTFSNLVWTECRAGTQMEWVTARNGVHAWWTMDHGGFSTTDYTLEFFTRTYHKQMLRQTSQKGGSRSYREHDQA